MNTQKIIKKFEDEVDLYEELLDVANTDDLVTRIVTRINELNTRLSSWYEVERTELLRYDD